MIGLGNKVLKTVTDIKDSKKQQDGYNYTLSSLSNYWGDKLKDDKMGGTCRTHIRLSHTHKTASRKPKEKIPLQKYAHK
jgi:hypothetical protein